MAKRRPRIQAATPESPPFRHLLDQARPVRDFAALLTQSFELLEAGLAAEGVLAEVDARRGEAEAAVAGLKRRLERLGEEVEQERLRRLEPAEKELREVTAQKAQAQAALKRATDEALRLRGDAQEELARAKAEAKRLRADAETAVEQARQRGEREQKDRELTIGALTAQHRELARAVADLEERRQQAVKAIEALIPR